MELHVTRRLLIVTAAGLLILAGLILLNLRGRPDKTRTGHNASLPVLGRIAPFSLTDADSHAFSSDALSNRIWVADFIFTTCGGICPIMTRNMRGLLDVTSIEEQVDMVSFTVNPAYDSPTILTAYARDYDADRPSWHFLTGPLDDIRQIAVESFRVGDINEPINHSPYFVLVDRLQRVRGYYDGTDATALKRLERDIQKLLGDSS
tara:strand:- start:4352 stop:4969 length:618 start_codon:yes stop_codon:yes gene_type:complete